RIDQASNTTALKSMLLKNSIRHAKAQAARIIHRTVVQPEVHSALLESIFRTKVPDVTIDHVTRLNRCPRAVAADHRPRRESLCHFYFELCISDHLHSNRLIAAQNIHAVDTRLEQIEIAL